MTQIFNFSFNILKNNKNTFTQKQGYITKTTRLYRYIAYIYITRICINRQTDRRMYLVPDVPQRILLFTDAVSCLWRVLAHAP